MELYCHSVIPHHGVHRDNFTFALLMPTPVSKNLSCLSHMNDSLILNGASSFYYSKT